MKELGYTGILKIVSPCSFPTVHQKCRYLVFNANIAVYKLTSYFCFCFCFVFDLVLVVVVVVVVVTAAAADDDDDYFTYCCK